MRTSTMRVAITVIVGLLIAACAPASSPASSIATPPSNPPASSAAASPGAGPSSTAAASTSVPPLSATASLPVNGSAREIGNRVLTAPGPNGSLYVSIPGSDGSVLALLDPTGLPRPGWPITVDDSTSCGLLLPVDDGSVRLVCFGADLPQRGGDPSRVRAFAFDTGGRPLAGWPVELPFGWPAGFVGSMVGNKLMHFTEQRRGLDVGSGSVSYEAWVTSVAVDGTLRSGVRVPRVESACCAEQWAVGPDSVAYGAIHKFGESSEEQKSSELLAVGFAGAPAGFPIEIDGLASEPSFDAAGRIHVTVNAGPDRTARAIIFETTGRAAAGGSNDLGFGATDECVGIEGSCEIPAAPLVRADGTRFVVGAYFNSTVAAGLRPSGQVLAGWPYRSGAGHQGKGNCAASDVCEGYELTSPAIGPDDVLYLLHGARNETVGGSIVAVGTHGVVRSGWPVELKRSGAEFGSVVVGSDGTVYALAIEPETVDTSSASLLAIAPDSTVLSVTTIVEP